MNVCSGKNRGGQLWYRPSGLKIDKKAAIVEDKCGISIQYCCLRRLAVHVYLIFENLGRIRA